MPNHNNNANGYANGYANGNSNGNRNGSTTTNNNNGKGNGKGSSRNYEFRPTFTQGFTLALVMVLFVLDANLTRELYHRTPEPVDAAVVGFGTTGTTTGTGLSSSQQSQSQSQSHRRCLGLEDGGSMDEILGERDLVYLLYPAKAGSSTIKEFSHGCLNLEGELSNAALMSPENAQAFLDHQSGGVVPPFVSGRIQDHRQFARIAKSAPPRSLVVYVHREETSRLKSAIRQVLGREEQDVIDEKRVSKVLEIKKAEIGMSGHAILTCQLYESLEDDGTDVVFLNYERVDDLLRLLRNRHCPSYVDLHRVNEGSSKTPKRVRITGRGGGQRRRRVEEGGDDLDETENETTTISDEDGASSSSFTVDLDEWIDARLGMLELAHNLRAGASCQRTTKSIERDLFTTCPDEAVLLESGVTTFGIGGIGIGIGA